MGDSWGTQNCTYYFTSNQLQLPDSIQRQLHVEHISAIQNEVTNKGMSVYRVQQYKMDLCNASPDLVFQQEAGVQEEPQINTRLIWGWGSVAPFRVKNGKNGKNQQPLRLTLVQSQPVSPHPHFNNLQVMTALLAQNGAEIFQFMNGVRYLSTRILSKALKSI